MWQPNAHELDYSKTKFSHSFLAVLLEQKMTNIHKFNICHQLTHIQKIKENIIHQNSSKLKRDLFVISYIYLACKYKTVNVLRDNFC